MARPLQLDDERIKTLYADGLSVLAISKIIGVGYKGIYNNLCRNGVKLRNVGARPGEKNHRFKGGFYVRDDGYVLQRGSRKLKFRHRVIAEQLLGRKLKSSEIVHHVYGDKSDEKNLVICTQSYHAALHQRMRKHPYWKQFTG